MTHRFLIAAAAALLTAAAIPAFAASVDEPHAHRGVLPPVRSAPDAVVLTSAERKRLERGEHVERHTKSDQGGSGVAIQYINARPETIWATILAYPRYTDWVKNVVGCSVYRKEGTTLYVDMETSLLGFRTRVFTKNDVRKDQGYMSWTLDYDRKSDVNDLVGYWRVQPVEGMPGVTRLEHSNSISIRGVPGFLVNYMTRDALSDGTDWVKREAERR